MSFRSLGKASGLLSSLRRLLLRQLDRDAETAVVVMEQSGAIPYRQVDGEIVFLIITSRSTGRWIFPKGGLTEGLSHAQCAAEEAFEEAGVRGNISAAPVGSYRTLKIRSGVEILFTVQMYPLEVTEQLNDWPEQDERHRRWVTLVEARRLLAEPGLAVLAEKVGGSVSGAN